MKPCINYSQSILRREARERPVPPAPQPVRLGLARPLPEDSGTGLHFEAGCSCPHRAHAQTLHSACATCLGAKFEAEWLSQARASGGRGERARTSRWLCMRRAGSARLRRDRKGREGEERARGQARPPSGHEKPKAAGRGAGLPEGDALAGGRPRGTMRNDGEGGPRASRGAAPGRMWGLRGTIAPRDLCSPQAPPLLRGLGSSGSPLVVPP